MTAHPAVSVIMPTYNSAQYLSDAIRSTLDQSYGDFELVVVDDGSTDETTKILGSVSDSRLHVVSLPRNSGLAAARNAGLEVSRGELIAWLDSDDMSRRDRLARQVSVLRRRPEVGLCGSWVKTFGDSSVKTWRYPRRAGVLASRMLFDDPFATSSVMVRRQAIVEAGGFDESFAPAEDYDLWERLSQGWQLVNVPRFLTSYRLHESQTSVRLHDRQAEAVRRIQARQLQQLHLDPSPEEWRIHLLVGVDWGEGLTKIDLPYVEAWLGKLKEANDARDLFPRRAFHSVLSHRLAVARETCQPSLRRSVSRRLKAVLL